MRNRVNSIRIKQRPTDSEYTSPCFTPVPSPTSSPQRLFTNYAPAQNVEELGRGEKRKAETAIDGPPAKRPRIQ